MGLIDVMRVRFRFFPVILAFVLSAAPSVVAQHQIEREAWIEMRKMFREVGPAPSIEHDVAGLTTRGEARKAGPRLIDRGPAVLPAVHATLLSPEVTPQHAIALLQVIRPLAHASSVPVLLELLTREEGTPLRRDVLLTLAHLPATEAALEFIRDLASGDEVWNTRRMAFTWFGFQRDEHGRPHAEALLQVEDAEQRAAGLYVLARLGDRKALAPIVRILEEGAPRNSRDLLLIALSELATPALFDAHAPEGLDWSPGFKNARTYTRYRAASAAERPEICLELLHSRAPLHRRLAVRCLLEAGRADQLRPAAAVDLEAPGVAALLRNEIRMAGWCVVDSDTEFTIEEPTASGSCR